MRVALVLVGVLLAAPAAEARVAIKTIPTRSDLVSGGQALVRVTGAKRFTAKVGKRNVTKAFKRRANGKVEGLVRGLKVGRNVLTVRTRKGGARLTITNHPNGGPVFAGPQIQPWKCQEKAVDKDCNQPPEFSYLYRPTDPREPGLLPYDPESPPSDVAMTTTDQGVEVPFIVRLELGYMDRDQYKVFTLFEPGKTKWSRWDPPKLWNQKVLVTHGGNCGGDYGTGNAPTDDFSGTIPGTPANSMSYVNALGRGFAVMTSALDNTGHNCNVAREAEALMMLKEHVAERYGDIRYTIGTGCSGGSIAQQTIANAYPRLVYDGLVITCAYPDTMTAGAQFADYHLLRAYFENPDNFAQGWTPVTWGQVEGRPDPVNAIAADELLFKAALAVTGDCVPDDQVYNAQSRPGGIRCSILDYMISIFGPRPRDVWTEQEKRAGRGFAGVPFGNEGIQYGLGALKSGLITADQFVDLNEKIGGVDIDMNPSPQRIPGDDRAIRNTYRSGLVNEGNNLGGVVIVDHAGPDPGIAHDYAHTWWIRDRMKRAQGHLDNLTLWFGPAPLVGDLNWPTEALLAVDKWLANIEKDRSKRTRAEKIKAARPPEAADRCEADVCETELATRYGTPREVAGGDRFNDILKCQLKPLSRDDDYGPLGLSDDQFARLQKVFPDGVCDWSKPGVGQQAVIPFLKYGNKQGKVIYGGRPMPKPPRSRVLR